MMVTDGHHEALAAELGVALGRAHELAGDARIDPRAVEAESLACQAAVDGRWGDVFVYLLAASAYDPDVYLEAWRAMALALLQVLGGAANGPGSGSIPTAPTVRGRRWGSAQGVVEELPSGSVRVRVPLSIGRNLAVILPPVAGDRHD